MIILGIETAVELVGVAVADDQGPRAGAWVRGGRRHAESLAPAIAHVLDQARTSLAEVDVVAVDVGPGLFTGLRVGVATAQGLAQGLGIGVIGVSSVEVLARAAFDSGWSGPVAAIVDGRRKEVFAARYRAPTDESHPVARYAPAALAAELASGDDQVLAVGNGALRYAATFAGAVLARIPDPPPHVLVALAAERIAGGAEPVRAGEVRPVYLREPDARINWVQR